MLGTYASAAFVCAGALVLGQAILRLCGAVRWSWLSAPVGVAAMMAIAIPSLHVPGRTTTVAVILFAVVLAAGVWLAIGAAHRPPLPGLLAGLPVALLCGVPFVAAGTAGTLGWSFDNDMASHLLLADAYRSAAVERVHAIAPDYPIGPHALVAVIAQGFGVGVDEAFAGLTIAAAILLGWTALAALRRPRPWAPFAATLLVGMPFLIAGYYGQGSFKELLEATFALAVAVLLAFPPQLGRVRGWIPVALLLAGVLSVYSFLGLAWPLAFLGLWLAGNGLRLLRDTGSPRALLAAARGGLVPVLAGIAVLAVVIVPQLPRLVTFFSNTAGTNGTGIEKSSLGNLAGPLPFWEAFGIWGNADYRFAAPDQFASGMWSAFAVGLVVFAGLWAIRRGEWMLVAATAMAAFIWGVSHHTQSPYVTAKALVLLSPLVMLVAVRALGERDLPGRRMPGWWWLAAPLLALLLLVRVEHSSWNALRYSRVGLTAHAQELRTLQPALGHRPTLFLGNDDFIMWELGETPVNAPVIGFQELPLRPRKPWVYARNYDLDSLDSATLNQFDWVIAPRDAASSAPPAQLEPVRRTRSFVLYRRTAAIPPTRILAEGESAAVALDCRSRSGRALVRAGGVATIRDASVVAALPLLAPGASATVSLALTPGHWDLVTPYGGPRPLRFTASGLDATLPTNLDRPGPRWPIGRIDVMQAGPVAVTVQATTNRWTPSSAVTTPQSLIAVPVGTEREVPLADACGKLVDHYVAGTG